ncbi:MAG: glycosyltransferase family 39 protein [Candidatus Aminicenantales bacterium]
MIKVQTPEEAGKKKKLILYLSVLFLAGSCLLCLLLRLKNLGNLSLWMDEGFYYLAAQKILELGYPLYPSGHILFKGILYAYLLAAFSLPIGLNEVHLRLFSVLVSVATIPVLYLLGRKFLSRGLAFLVVIIIAFSTWETEYARLVLYFAPLQLVYITGLYFFFKGFLEDRRKYRLLTIMLFVLAPHVHQLAMGLWFCFPALFLVKGVRRFLKKDVILSFSLVTLAYVLVQVHEAFFWKVGYVYEKSVTSLGGFLHYFFTSFSLEFFKEILKSFPRMGPLIFLGVFLLLGEMAGQKKKSPADDSYLQKWYFLTLCLLFPLLFFGFFRTHIQPRYLFQLRPVLILLYLIALWRTAGILSHLMTSPFASGKTKEKVASFLSLGLLAAGLFAFTDQAGLGKVRSVINRKYGDRITTDVITRSGRFEHYDHRGVGLYVRNFLQENDLVVAMHTVFQYIYAGRVDYWLWSGGPGTWDAWEMTSEGWKDFYVGSRWLSNLESLKRIIQENTGRRVWLITSPSIQRRDHISQEIAAFIQENEDKRVFRGKDGMSEVYLWHDKDQELKTSSHLLEAEWLPASIGQIVYPEDASKKCALFLDKKRDRNLGASYKLRGVYGPGPYKLVLRAKIEAGESILSQERILGMSLLSSRDQIELRSCWVSAKDFSAAGQFQDLTFSFFLPRENELHLKLVYRGKSSIWLDSIDLVPAKE